LHYKLIAPHLPWLKKSKNAREAAKLQGVFQILPDHAGRIWICSLSGLFYVNVRDRRLGPQRLAPVMGPQGRVYEAVRDPHETLWFISDSGLFRLSGSTWTHVKSLRENYRKPQISLIR
jgi:ligand-binding sensor domain-containing protein